MDNNKHKGRAKKYSNRKGKIEKKARSWCNAKDPANTIFFRISAAAALE